ncbi:hypothetical protein DWB63_16100 [Pseudodesulfovibrio sp. S3]|nr:hypothetical protein DWB63_16100 [Pseudodesulfovibrio sp. S3]
MCDEKCGSKTKRYCFSQWSSSDIKQRTAYRRKRQICIRDRESAFGAGEEERAVAVAPPTFFDALPAGFFFGWAAPKKNQKNAASQRGRRTPRPKKLIGPAPLPDQGVRFAPPVIGRAAPPLRQLLRARSGMAVCGLQKL